eukprot:5573703-Amphidinium_carterae.1
MRLRYNGNYVLYHRLTLRIRHTSIRAHRLTEAVNQGNASLGWVGTKDQRSDYLTKLAPKMFQHACCDSLGMGWVSE